MTAGEEIRDGQPLKPGEGNYVTADSEPGFSKERRLAPQITIGLLTDACGFPLAVEAIKGNQSETPTRVPIINASFKAARQLTT